MDILAIIGLFVIIYYAVYVISVCILDSDLGLAFKEKYGKPVSSLKGKVVWITGASSGIGEHLAYVLAKAGCKLILSARRTAELERVRRKCLDENSSLNDDDVYVYFLDVTKLDTHEAAFQHVVDKFKQLDILVQNAGRSQRAQWENIEVSVDREMFELNVFSIVSLSRVAVRHFIQSGGGHLVLTSSIAGFTPVPGSPTYCGTKHALHGYFRSLLLDHPDKNIDVTFVCPGPIHTDSLAQRIIFTERSGENYGINTEQSTNKVSAGRCAALMGVAIANKMDEVWIAKPPVLRLVYFAHFFPKCAIWMVRLLGSKYLSKVRDK